MKKHRPTLLVVNADDFGLTTEINEGIELAHQQGILTSTSLMPVGNAFDSAVNIARQNSKLGVGIHLTLVEESPLSQADQVRSLLDAEERFHRSAKRFGIHYLAGRIDLHQVELELDNQMMKVFDTGLRITHLDSHQHIHLLPRVADVIRKLAKKYGVSCIRSTTERFDFSHGSARIPPSRHVELALIRLLNYLSGRDRLESVDYFAGFVQGGCLDEQSLLGILDNLQPGCSTELMCHPGIGHGDNGKSHWDYDWNTELKALISPKVINAIREHGIELVNWGGIPSGAR